MDFNTTDDDPPQVDEPTQDEINASDAAQSEEDANLKNEMRDAHQRLDDQRAQDLQNDTNQSDNTNHPDDTHQPDNTHQPDDMHQPDDTNHPNDNKPSDNCGDGLSFAANTPVATATGEQAIGKLQVGEQVWAYNPQTQKMELKPIQKVWLNHDNDLVDLTLVTTSQDAHGGEKQSKEVLHTNEKHPFLTKEKGFIPVSQLKPGMHVLQADGSYGVVGKLVVVPGAQWMYNLTVAQDHTYAVGIEQWIVHNCTNNDGGSNLPSDTKPSSINDIFNNPSSVQNMTPQEVAQLAADDGWTQGTLGRGSHEGQGFTFREPNAKGTGWTGRYLQWHPGGGQHGPRPYWKVSSPQTGLERFFQDLIGDVLDDL